MARTTTARTTQTALNIETLESRLVPTTFAFDYSRDTAGFFADPARRQALEAAGATLASRIDTPLAALAATGGNFWTARFADPATGAETQLDNLVVPADTLVVYVGGRNLENAEAGEGGSGGYRASGDQAFLNRLAHRQPAGISIWGGSIAFDTDQNWEFTPAAPANGQTDFHTVATHELIHLLGFGTSQHYSDLIVNGKFAGPAAVGLNGGPVNLSGDLAHFRQGTESGNQPASLNPYLFAGQQYGAAPLDYAVLRDIGWTITSLAPSVPPPANTIDTPVVPPVVTPPAVPPAPVPPAIPPAVTPTPPVNTPTPISPAPEKPAATPNPVAASGTADGRVQFADGKTLTPFPGFAGVVRTVTADVNADGTPDVVSVTGPGGGSRVRVTDGKTGADLLPSFSVFEATYTGGLFVAAADFDHDGKADVVVSPDLGGGARVTILRVTNGRAQTLANFQGIDDASFRGGARVAAADVNGDGTPDIVVGAGFGGGPRVAIFDGNTASASRPAKLVNDFYAFDGADAANLRNGVFPSAGDLNGDGKADLVFGGGPGGGPRVVVLNGAVTLTSPDFAKAVPLANFFAFETDARGGVRTAVKDADGDGTPDLVVGSGDRTPAQVKVYAGGRFAGGTPAVTATFEPFGSAALTDGVYVG